MGNCDFSIAARTVFHLKKQMAPFQDAASDPSILRIAI
jgi:hypothetical protein